MIRTDRLHADPQAMRDRGGAIDRDTAAAKLARYCAALADHGIARMHVSDAQGFVGYVGLMPRGDDYPMGAHVEAGWRLLPGARGKGYTTEAARHDHPRLCDDEYTRNPRLYRAGQPCLTGGNGAAWPCPRRSAGFRGAGSGRGHLAWPCVDGAARHVAGQRLNAQFTAIWTA